MYHVYAIALYLDLLKLDRLVDGIPQVMPLFRQEDPHSDIGVAFHRSFTLCRGYRGGGFACTPVSLSVFFSGRCSTPYLRIFFSFKFATYRY